MAKAKTTETGLVKVDPQAIKNLSVRAQEAANVMTITDPIEQMFAKSEAIVNLRAAIQAPGVLDSIMKTQGSKLGFRTDKDGRDGYGPDVVGDCVIEALFHGILPTNNEMNIIAGNFYATREGFEGLIRRRGAQIGLTDVMVAPGIAKNQAGGAVIDVDISWKMHGVQQQKTRTFAIKVNAQMGHDAIVGKATRKALHWLWGTVTGSEVGEADVEDTGPADLRRTPPVSSPLETPQEAAGTDSDTIPVSAEEVADDTPEPTGDDGGDTPPPWQQALTAIENMGITAEQAVDYLVNGRKGAPWLQDGDSFDQLGDAQAKQILGHLKTFKAAVEAYLKEKAA